MPILIVAFTTILSFLPVFFLTGAEGKLFKPLAFTKTLSIFAALLISLFLLPPLSSFLQASRFKKKNVPGSARDNINNITAQNNENAAFQAMIKGSAEAVKFLANGLGKIFSGLGQFTAAAVTALAQANGNASANNSDNPEASAENGADGQGGDGMYAGIDDIGDDVDV